jgi:hypothetical protein
MSRLFCRCLFFVTVLLMVSQSAFAESPSFRTQKRFSILAEASLGGPNGTVALGASYDFTPWIGITLGGGYSIYSDALMGSLKLDLRALHRANVDVEHGLQWSIGPSFRGQSKEGPDRNLAFLGPWTNEEKTADHTLFVSNSIGYTHAGRKGLRVHVFLGLDVPVYAKNHRTVTRSVSLFSKTKTTAGDTEPELNFFAGASIGRAF